MRNWVQWTGVYTSTTADLGNTFMFEALFDLDGQHAIALDGPIVSIRR